MARDRRHGSDIGRRRTCWARGLRSSRRVSVGGRCPPTHRRTRLAHSLRAAPTHRSSHLRRSASRPNGLQRVPHWHRSASAQPTSSPLTSSDDEPHSGHAAPLHDVLFSAERTHETTAELLCCGSTLRIHRAFIIRHEATLEQPETMAFLRIMQVRCPHAEHARHGRNFLLAP